MHISVSRILSGKRVVTACQPSFSEGMLPAVSTEARLTSQAPQLLGFRERPCVPAFVSLKAAGELREFQSELRVLSAHGFNHGRLAARAWCGMDRGPIEGAREQPDDGDDESDAADHAEDEPWQHDADRQSEGYEWEPSYQEGKRYLPRDLAANGAALRVFLFFLVLAARIDFRLWTACPTAH